VEEEEWTGWYGRREEGKKRGREKAGEVERCGDELEEER
jgi:hypothetical protein